MRDTVDIAAPAPRQLQGRHVLALFVAFFAVIFVVKGYMLMQALSTHSGVVASEPYRKGLAYNQRIAAGERQSALAWVHTITAVPDGLITIDLAGPDGRGIGNLTVTGFIGRPSTSAHDRVLALSERTAGRYAGNTAPLESGAWLVSIEVRLAPTDSEPIYRARSRLWLKP